MPILLACGEEGLLEWRGAWRKKACPLACPSLAARDGAAVDAQARLGWREGCWPVPPGAECLLPWASGYAVLSGETDGLSLLDASGQLLRTSPAGVYPQDMCLLPGGRLLAVCGGAEGRVRLFSLPEAAEARCFPVAGNVQRIAWSGGGLLALSLVEEGGLMCLMSRIALPSGRVEATGLLPGLPGAVCADGRGGWWAAASETLCHVDGRGRVDRRMGGWGLIRHMALSGASLLVTDPVAGVCALTDASGRTAPRILYRGDVRQALFL